jgi:molybdenum cofactor cytidylyltransferase
MIATKPGSSPLPAIIVLAAGLSSRLGQPKALASIHGRSLLQRTAAALAGLPPGSIHIVLPPRSPLHKLARRQGWQCIVNPNRSRGLSSSVACGIVRCRQAPALLFLPVDLADMTRADLQRLLRHWRSNRRRVVARDHRGRPVTPLILPLHLYNLRHLLQGDTGLQPLIGALLASDVRRVRLRGARIDIDTPEDLRSARQRFTLATF